MESRVCYVYLVVLVVLVVYQAVDAFVLSFWGFAFFQCMVS